MPLIDAAAMVKIPDKKSLLVFVNINEKPVVANAKLVKILTFIMLQIPKGVVSQKLQLIPYSLT